MDEYVVAGISFSNRADYETALKEEKNIEYITAKIDITNSKSALRLYNSLIEKDSFRTPVGLAFLKQLYDMLIVSNDIDKSQILSINADSFKNNQNVKNNRDIKSITFKRAGDNNTKKMKDQIVLLRSVVVLLIIAVIVMFIFTINADTLTYKNAREDVINEYENWSEELNKREEALNEREENLNNNP